jgi:hypothetical protein
MSLSVYPSQIYGLKLNSVRTAEFSTLVQSSASKSETRIAQAVNPIWHWQLLYEQLFNDLTNPNYSESELATLMGFYLQQGGRFGQFLFPDPEDNAVTNQTLQLVNDGAGNYYSPIQREMGGFLEDITDLNPQNGSGLTVKANGVAQTVGLAGAVCGGGANCLLLGPGLAIPGYSFGGLYLKWCAAPTPPIAASFGFYFRVRFEQDQQDFDRFLYNLWTIGGAEAGRGAGMVKLVTARPPGV